MSKHLKHSKVSYGNAKMYREVAARTGIGIRTCRHICTAWVQIISERILSQKPIAITGLGTFDHRLRKGRHFGLSGTWSPDRLVPRFRLSSYLQAEIYKRRKDGTLPAESGLTPSVLKKAELICDSGESSPVQQVFKIVEVGNDGKLRTLFHGVNGSRLLPSYQWLEAEEKMVHDGSEGSTEYLSGWHVLPSWQDAKNCLQKFSEERRPTLRAVRCVVKNVRKKEHSPANVYLAKWLMITVPQ